MYLTILFIAIWGGHDVYLVQYRPPTRLRPRRCKLLPIAATFDLDKFIRIKLKFRDYTTHNAKSRDVTLA